MSLRLPIPLYVSFLTIFYVGVHGLSSVSLVLASVPALLLLCLSTYASLSFFNVFLPDELYLCLFCLFLVSGLALFFFFSLLTRSDLSSFATGSPFGLSQLLRVIPSPPSPDLSLSLSAPTMFSVSSGRFSSSSCLVFCEWYTHFCEWYTHFCGFCSECPPLFSSWGCALLFYNCLPFFFFT